MFFFFNDTATTEIYTLSLHDALPIYLPYRARALKNLKTQVLFSGPPKCHAFATTILKLEEANIREFASSVAAANTFSGNHNSELLQLVTNEKATEQQKHDLLNVRQYGSLCFDLYVSKRILSVPSASAPVRKRRLQTFKPVHTTVSRLKKVEKDRTLVMTCLKRQLAQCKKSGQPVTSLGQFIELPRAIANADGTLYKGTKANTTRILKARYSEAFLDTLPQHFSPDVVILEGMFMINSSPLGQHRTFKDYALFLVNKWIKLYLASSSVKQIHVVLITL